MGAGSSLLQNATGSQIMLTNDFATDKRAKTPMLHRVEIPMKQRLTIQNIERMESAVKQHVDGDEVQGAHTTNNSPRSNRKPMNLKT